MNITIKQLKAFVTIADMGSFAEAAELVHCSQPALSVTIRNLEEEVGGKLFVRTTRSLVLTPEGRAFLPMARRLLDDMEQAVYHLQSRFKLEEGRLTIAAIPAFACNQLPPILLALQDKHPGLQVQVNDVVTEDVVSSVVNNRVELGITFDPGPLQGVDFHPLFEDRFVMVVSPHIAADFPRNAPLSWQDLADVPYIALQSPSSVRTLIQAALEENGMAYPQPSYESHQLATIGRMVANGLGYSAVPSLTRQQMQEMGAICFPIARPIIGRQMGIIFRRRAPMSRAAEAFITLLEQQKWDDVF